MHTHTHTREVRLERKFYHVRPYLIGRLIKKKKLLIELTNLIRAFTSEKKQL